jgi:GDP-L-fucose synthase
MERSERIYVAGHRGLAGSAILRRLELGGYRDVLTRAHSELELTDAGAVEAFFRRERPDHVFLAAARVGGILANSTRPAEFIRENLLIQTNVIHAAHAHGVKRLLFLGSSCIYPKLAPQPLREAYLLSGALEPTNEAYAIAKIAGIKMCAAYNRQYGTNFLSVMPANLYGPGDNYDLGNSHVLPALIRKAHEAKRAGAQDLVVWGTGTPRREFLFSDDLADACVFLMERCDAAGVGECINVGAGDDQPIAELARVVAEVVGFEGRLAFDPSKPDGTPRKLLDVARMKALGWQARTGLRVGIAAAYRDFLARLGAPARASAPHNSEAT